MGQGEGDADLEGRPRAFEDEKGEGDDVDVVPEYGKGLSGDQKPGAGFQRAPPSADSNAFPTTGSAPCRASQALYCSVFLSSASAPVPFQ